jgi:hypothetical protein
VIENYRPAAAEEKNRAAILTRLDALSCDFNTTIDRGLLMTRGEICDDAK